ncbi:outer membrane protein transport protein, partial [Flavobacterium sp.]|uniref:OmpP1/FadL family transporter n=1 Tax=Flavobacterium sp. TaxID=239 RepID=UPI00260834A1
MKKNISLAFLLALTCGVVQSQEIKDALRYSQDNTTGTARFRAMSGAFGALGGDLSAIGINPAGSSIFVNNQVGFTVSNSVKKNDSNYFGTNTTEKDNSLELNQAGGVFVFNSQNPDSNWKKIAIGLNFENTNNFNNSLFSAGTNPTRSVGNYFLSYANTGNNGAPVPQEFVNTEPGESIGSLYSFLGTNLPNNQFPQLNGFAAQQAMLGYQGYVINAVNSNNNNSPYTSNVAAGGNYYQENTVVNSGYSGKLSFNGSTSYKDKLYIGLNLNSHFIDLRQSSVFYEENTNPLDANYKVTRLQFNNDLYTYGSGFSFQLGAIAKVNKELRAGLTYESSTWYRVNDELSQRLIAVSTNNAGSLPSDVVDPNYTNIYAPYKLQTPSKVTGSLAYVFGKVGLLSVDYAVKDYSNTKFKPNSDPYFKSLNTQMSNSLQNTAELRIGAEYKIERLSLRGGYRYEQSPYKNNTTIGDLTG